MSEANRETPAVSKKQQRHKNGTCTVGPGVHANLMARHEFLDQHSGKLDDARANHEEGCLDIFRVQVIEKFPALSKALRYPCLARKNKKIRH